MQPKNTFKVIHLLPILAALITCFIFIILTPRAAHAATAELRELTRGRTYTCYDVTGDGRHDKFKYTAGQSGYTNYYINNKYVSRSYSALRGTIYWARITNGKVFLILNYQTNNRQSNKVLQYKRGKFVTVSGKAVDKYNMSNCGPSRVAGHSIFFTGVPSRMPKQFVENYNRVTGTSQFRLENGTFKLVTRYLKVGGTTTFKTNVTMNYVDGSPFIPKGATVKIIKIFKPSDADRAYGVCYQLKYGNKTGWLYTPNS